MVNHFLGPPQGPDDHPVRADARVLRDRQQAHSRALDRAAGRQSAFTSARQLVQVYNGGSMGSAPDLYYFTHPVLVTGAETEGGFATLTADTDTTIPVVVLGHTPSVGDYLIAYAASGRWVSEKGGSSGGGSESCLPCSIPQEDLTISWTNLLSEDGSATLVYTAGPPAWKTPCVDDGLIFELGCNGGKIELRVIFFISGGCPDGESNFCSNLGVPPLALTLSSFTCTPFSLTFTVEEEGCPAIYGAGNVQLTITL